MGQTKELSVHQTALRLGVTLKYVRDLLYEHKLPGAYKMARVWRIPTNAIEQWEEARKEQANGAAGLQR